MKDQKWRMWVGLVSMFAGAVLSIATMLDAWGDPKNSIMSVKSLVLYMIGIYLLDTSGFWNDDEEEEE